MRLPKLGSGLLVLMALSGCGSTVTHRQTIQFSKGTIDIVITSVGGALGKERYELSYMNGDHAQTFFSGSNFSEFNVAERGGKLGVQICKGLIDHAEPIGIGSNEDSGLVRLDIDRNCRDKRQKA